MIVRLELPENKKMATGGDNFTGKFKLKMPLPISEGQTFALRESGKTVAAGVVSKILPDTEEDIAKDLDRVKRKAAKAKTSKV